MQTFCWSGYVFETIVFDTSQTVQRITLIEFHSPCVGLSWLNIVFVPANISLLTSSAWLFVTPSRLEILIQLMPWLTCRASRHAGCTCVDRVPLPMCLCVPCQRAMLTCQGTHGCLCASLGARRCTAFQANLTWLPFPFFGFGSSLGRATASAM